MTELVKLRQEQQTTKNHLKQMEDRLQGTEQRQQQMMAFLARVMRNPELLQQLVSQNDKRKELEEEISRKRRRRIDLGLEMEDVGTSSSVEQDNLVKMEGDMAMPDDLFGLEIDADLDFGDESLLLDPSETVELQEDVKVELGGEDLNDDFWDELLGGEKMDSTTNPTK